MLPDWFGSHSSMYYMFRRRSLEHRRTFILCVYVRVFISLALLVIVTVWRAGVGVGEGILVDLAIGLEVLLLIKVHSNYYRSMNHAMNRFIGVYHQSLMTSFLIEPWESSSASRDRLEDIEPLECCITFVSLVLYILSWYICFLADKFC